MKKNYPLLLSFLTLTLTLILFTLTLTLDEKLAQILNPIPEFSTSPLRWRSGIKHRMSGCIWVHTLHAKHIVFFFVLALSCSPNLPQHFLTLFATHGPLHFFYFQSPHVSHFFPHKCEQFCSPRCNEAFLLLCRFFYFLH